MATIVLRNGKGEIVGEAIVDADDLNRLLNYSWCLSVPDGYVKRSARVHGGSQVAYFMHREVLRLVKGDGKTVDHINRNKLDNRKSNLRIVSVGQNNQNLSGGRGKSGHHGVHWREHSQHWIVRISANGKTHHGGYFRDLEAAKIAATNLRARVAPFSYEAHKSEAA